MKRSGGVERCQVPHPASRGVQRHPVGGEIGIAIMVKSNVLDSTGDDEGVTPVDEASLTIWRIELRYDYIYSIIV